MRTTAGLLGIVGAAIGLIFALSLLWVDLATTLRADAQAIDLVATLGYAMGFVGSVLTLRRHEKSHAVILTGAFLSLILYLAFGSTITLVPFAMLVVSGFLAWRPDRPIAAGTARGA